MYLLSQKGQLPSSENDNALFIALLNLNINTVIGVNEVFQIEKYLKDYQIIVFNNELMNEIVYKGVEKNKKISYSIIITISMLLDHFLHSTARLIIVLIV